MTTPAADRDRSPLTGYTREHWEHWADVLLDGARRHASPAGARVRFPSARAQDATDELEGFARSFLLAALRLAGAHGHPVPGLAERLATALDAGTRPGHPEQWPGIGHHDQVLVEATAVATALHWSRDRLWDLLDQRVRDQVVEWLSGAHGVWCADNNHVLFGATVQAFLASVGATADLVAVDGALDRIEDWYAGDGWYSDGVGRRFDHYNAWAFHLYPFVIEQLLTGGAADEAGRAADFDAHRRRLRAFVEDAQHLVSADGQPVLQGRSLIYRWATVAPFWTAELQGVSPLPPGRTRRLASGTLRGFVTAGVLDDGVLDLGWTRPAPDLLQSYNAPGSPLWAAKGFLGLLLPPDHPVWRDREVPLAAEHADVVRPLAGPRWLAVTTHADGIARLLNFGSDGHPRRPDPLYRRLAYSTATVPVTVEGLADNTVSVGRPDGSCTHRGLLGGTVRRHGGAARWRLDAAGRDVRVDVGTVVHGATEIRVARLSGIVGQEVRVTGWALPSDRPVVTDVDGEGARAGTADGLVSAMGWVCRPVPADRCGQGVEARPHESALGDHVALPWLSATVEGEGVVHLAWFVRLDRGGMGPVRPTVAWTSDGAVVTVGGTRHHCAWVREATWPADTVNQGVVRIDSGDPGRSTPGGPA